MMKIKSIIAVMMILGLTAFACAEEAEVSDTESANLYMTIQPSGENEYRLKTWVYSDNGKALTDYRRDESIVFGSGQAYTRLKGVTTFRGNNYRDTASYGSLGNNPTELNLKWYKSIGGIDKWTGVGWTGEPAVVQWDIDMINRMNIYEDKKREGLTEVIYATLDGHIYFLDLSDGSETRDPINIGAPIKGSVTVDPRGYPLLYCGQGIDEVGGKSVKIGTRVFSLIDLSVLYFINGRDDKAIRHWYAFDAAPLVDSETDTLIQVGENGILYTVKLNTVYDADAGTISVNPETVKYAYNSNVSKRLGIENSVIMYNSYAMFNDNSGLLQCVDINTMAPMWSFFTGDDTDSTMALEVEKDGVALYTACELDLRGNSGDCYIRKLDAITGKEIWRVDEHCQTSGDTNGGAFGSPAVGKGSLSKYIYYHIARTKDGGTLLCIDKDTGETAWRLSLKSFGWSSPVCAYSDSGKGYVFVASSSGKLRMIDGLTGDVITKCDLGANVEGSPVIFNSTLVVGTRGEKIIAVSID